jgi:thiopurine S-methyltransferase
MEDHTSEIHSALYWEQRYQQNDAPWDMGIPSPPFVQYLASYADTAHKILIPGGGKGHELAWMMQQGFTSVYLLDWSPASCAAVSTLYSDIPAAHIVCEDFFAHTGAYDLILEQTFFCALPPNMRADYVRHMHQLLKPGGKLAGVWFQFPLTEEGPPFGGSAEEYRALFSEGFDIVKMETCLHSHPARAGKELWIEMIKK